MVWPKNKIKDKSLINFFGQSRAGIEGGMNCLFFLYKFYIFFLLFTNTITLGLCCKSHIWYFICTQLNFSPKYKHFICVTKSKLLFYVKISCFSDWSIGQTIFKFNLNNTLYTHIIKHKLMYVWSNFNVFSFFISYFGLFATVVISVPIAFVFLKIHRNMKIHM